MNKSINQNLKDTLRQSFANTVCVLTTSDDTGLYGMTVTAVIPVSMEPPSMLVSVNRSTTIFSRLQERGHFCINILSSKNVRLCEIFSQVESHADRFQAANWASGPFDLPYLTDVQASLFFTTDQQLSYGSHDLFIGRVIEVLIHETVEPLIWLNGKAS